MSWDICQRIEKRRERRNLAKRMRDARMGRAMARLTRMSNVEECIKDLLRVCTDLKRGELEYLICRTLEISGLRFALWRPTC